MLYILQNDVLLLSIIDYRIFTRIFNQADTVIHKNNGILDKFMGDGIMAIFGFKDNNADDNIKSALHALNLAIELTAFLKILEMNGLNYGKINLVLI